MLVMSVFSGCSAKKSSNAASGNGTVENSDVNPGSSPPIISGNEGALKDKVGNPTVDVTNGKPPGTSSYINFGGHKIIQTGDIFIETVDFDKSIKNIVAYVESIGGFIQSENVQGKSANYTTDQSNLRSGKFVFRVPYEKFPAFFAKASDFGAVKNQSRNGEDITDQYSDTATKLATLKIRQERLQTLMKKATKLSDIIEIEKEIQNVAYEIDTLTGNLKKLDSLVSFSTISVNIQEVAVNSTVSPSTKASLGERMWFSLRESFKGIWIGTQTLLVAFMYLLPYIIFLLVLAFVGLRIVKKVRKKKV